MAITSAIFTNEEIPDTMGVDEEGNPIVTKVGQRASINATINGASVSIPNDPASRHRRMIAEWEDEGNTITPYVEPAPEPKKLTREEQIEKALIRKGLISKTEIDAEVARQA